MGTQYRSESIGSPNHRTVIPVFIDTRRHSLLTVLFLSHLISAVSSASVTWRNGALRNMTMTLMMIMMMMMMMMMMVMMMIMMMIFPSVL